jgi:hypothetical protein
MSSRPFLSDSEQNVVAAVSRLAKGNPFEPSRIENERQALGPAFAPAAAVWHVDADLQGTNPNVGPLSELAETLAGSLRRRLAAGARSTPEQLRLYEGLIYYLLFYRFESSLLELIHSSSEGRAATYRLAFYGEFRAAFEHFFAIRGVEFPFEPDPDHALALGFQIRRAFHHTYWQIVGGSTPVAQLRASVWRSIFTHDLERYQRALIGRMADIPTLILGESGTGKELAARAIAMSRYIPVDPRKQAFVEDFAAGYRAVNLSALSSTLIESELFGHKKGAFTGAVQDREGWLEACGIYGTIFLDEIGELDPTIQVKLLRALQSRVLQRIGETEDRPFRGKIVAATNRDLETEMMRGGFREDLYYRLCADIIRMPTLREQVSRAPEELESLVRVIARRMVGDEADALTDEAVTFIHDGLPQGYDWPGNVRELEQCVRSVLVKGSYSPVRRRLEEAGPGIAAALLRGEGTADQLLREYVTRVYAVVGSYEKAARVLELDRRTVKAKVDPELLAELRESGRDAPR